MEVCRKTYVFNRMVTVASMYIFDVLQKWDHSTRKSQHQLDSEFSKFYKRVKLIALYSQKTH